MRAAAMRLLGAAALAVVAAGCQQQSVHYRHAEPFRVKNDAPPEVVYCNDYTGHRPGAKPFVLGGTCCCNPSQALIEAYHRDGLLLDYDLERLVQLYRSLGIKTLEDHSDCNNMCQWGPHVLQGGKCMVPPTPGTQHYEEIITGRFRIPQPPTEKKRRK